MPVGRGVANRTNDFRDTVSASRCYKQGISIYKFNPACSYKEGFYMQKFWKINSLTNLRVLLTCAIFSAISIVLGKFLAISIGDTIRISLENLTIILSGILFGPLAAAFTGLTADIIGCILRGYAINPILTLAAMVIGFLSGAVYFAFKKANRHIRLVFTVLIPHIIGSVILKTIGLCIWFNYPFYPTLVARITNYIIVALAEIIIIEILLKNKSFIKTIGDTNEL